MGVKEREERLGGVLGICETLNPIPSGGEKEREKQSKKLQVADTLIFVICINFLGDIDYLAYKKC